jgi:hypothetical protein
MSMKESWFAIGVVASFAIHISIGRENLKEVANHWRLVVEPTFGERVFPVIAIAFTGVITTLVTAKTEQYSGVPPGCRCRCPIPCHQI